MTDCKLVMLKLAGTGMTARGAMALSLFVGSSSTLAKLELGGNALGPEGAEALAKGLATSPSLTQLNLRGNGLGVDGWRAIWTALGDSTGQFSPQVEELGEEYELSDSRMGAAKGCKRVQAASASPAGIWQGLPQLGRRERAPKK